MKITSSTAPIVALRLSRTARPIRPNARADPSSGAWVAGVSVGTPETGMAMARDAVLVRGSSSAVRTSATRIANSTATVISRNRPCMSG